MSSINASKLKSKKCDSHVKNFKCNVTDYEIELYYDEESALINNIKTDHKHMKSLMLLLKNMINWINAKNIKIINILKKIKNGHIPNSH